MSWRSGTVVAILAFAGGAVLYGWLASAGLSPWGRATPVPMSATPAPLPPETNAPVPNPAAAMPVLPQIVQPVADSARTEAMLVAMAARRAIEAGAPLGELAPRLQASFAASQSEALARVLAADKEKLTPAKLLSEFDAIAPTLRREPEMTWAGLQRELSTLFVIRRSDTAPEPVDAQLQRARDYLSSGNVEAAIRFAATLPGAANARAWMARAQRYVETQRALDRLEQAALALPVAAPAQQAVPPPASPPPGPGYGDTAPTL